MRGHGVRALSREVAEERTRTATDPHGQGPAPPRTRTAKEKPLGRPLPGGENRPSEIPSQPPQTIPTAEATTPDRYREYAAVMWYSF